MNTKNNILLIVLLVLTPFIMCAQAQQFDDEFNSPCTLSSWQNITAVEGWTTPDGSPAEHLEEHDIGITAAGALTMIPYTSSWFGNWRGVLLFKEWTGDFVFTSEIAVTNRTGQAIPPSTNYSLAGLMIRTPTGLYNPPADTTGIQNYIFSSIGRATNASQFQLEIKTTTDSNSTLNIQTIGAANNRIFMRVARIVNAIIVLSSFDNSTWVVRRRYDRSDFPDTLQLGFVAYTDWPNVQSVGYETHNVNILNDDFNTANGTNYNWQPDIIGEFGFARVDTVILPMELEGVNLVTIDTSGTTFDFLKYSSIPEKPVGSKIWLGSIDSDWNNPLNWSDGIVPQSGDEVLLGNCSCPEVAVPILSSTTPVFSSFRIEEGATLTINPSGILNTDLTNSDAYFIVDGQISNEGAINVNNASNK